METISNVVSTVSGTVTKAIYGEQPANASETAGNEPVSGEQGKGTATDPYDRGNSGTFLKNYACIYHGTDGSASSI